MAARRRTSVSILGSAALAAAICIQGGCGDAGVSSDEAVASLGEPSVIGNNDFIKVASGGTNIPAKYRPFLNAFGRLHVNGGLCTATHVGKGIALTAGHCFDATEAPQTNTACSGDFVEWGYIGGATASRSDCVKVLSKEKSGDLEYSIFQVSPVPPVSLPVNLKTKPASGTTLTVFSNPEGRPLEWSQTCPLSDPGKTEFTHTCDTQGGSSGAVVIDDTTLEVIGIHWGGSGTGNLATYVISTPLAEIFAANGVGAGGAGMGGAAAGGGAGAGGKGGAGGSSGGAGGIAGQGASAGGIGGAAGASAGAAGASAGAAGVVGGAAGTTNGSAGNSGSSGPSGVGGASASGGQAGTSAMAGTAGATVLPIPESSDESDGCGCRVGAPREAHWATPWLGLAALVLVRRRRRREP